MTKEQTCKIVCRQFDKIMSAIYNNIPGEYWGNVDSVVFYGYVAIINALGFDMETALKISKE